MPCPTLIYDDALLNPETSILIQKRHPYTRNVNSETLRDSKNAFLHGEMLLDLLHKPA